MQCQNPCFGAFNRLNELLEVHFKFHFNLINQLHNGLLTGRPWCILTYSNPGTQLGAQNKDFGADSQNALPVIRPWHRLIFCSQCCSASQVFHHQRQWSDANIICVIDRLCPVLLLLLLLIQMIVKL